jgi:hypothetical protein
MHTSARRCWARAAAPAALLCALLATAPACKPGFERDPEKHGFGPSDTTSTGQTIGKLSQRCELDETVSEPAENTPEWTARELLAAARSPVDERAAFARFFEQFQGQREDWVRSQYWPRAMANIGYYVPVGDAVTFGICRRETMSDGKVKLFIKSLDDSKTHSPITFEQIEDGAWKVTNYSP